MIDTARIFRVVTSATDHTYAASPDGERVEWYASYKQAARAHGELPVTIACGRWPGCQCAEVCDYWSGDAFAPVEADPDN